MRHSFLVFGVVVILLAGCSGEAVGYETVAGDEGSVLIVSDCPNTDQLLSGGNADGLPHISSTQDREAIEVWLGNGDNSAVVPRNGEVWERLSDGTVVVTQVEDFMIEVTIDDATKCPSMPASNNGVPVVYRIASD